MQMGQRIIAALAAAAAASTTVAKETAAKEAKVTKVPSKPRNPKPVCPGEIDVEGLDAPISLIPTGWKAPFGPEKMELRDRKDVLPYMDSRSYMATRCEAGKYNNTDYLRTPLLGRTMRYSVDLHGAGCGCNAAFYLTSMAHNEHESECFDYYCDANNVCGQSCSEIDIQEANLYAFHATLHGKKDPFGIAMGEGGGGPGWNGPRDWTADEYGPGAECIDTAKSYKVAVSFPTDEDTGKLVAMWITLSQEKADGDPCKLSVDLDHYKDMPEMHQELERGMTPIISYWADDDMLWLDGQGDDRKGHCDTGSKKKCPEYVRFGNFSISDIVEEDRPPPAPSTTGQDKSPVQEGPNENDWQWHDDNDWGQQQQQQTWDDQGTQQQEQTWDDQGTQQQEQTGGSLDWNSWDDQPSGPQPDDNMPGALVEDGNCVEFDNFRKAEVGGRATHVNLGNTAFGASMSWEECRKLCSKEPKCKQAVFYKPEQACFGQKEALGPDQDGQGGLNHDFISAQCNSACAEWNNWRKSEAGEHIPLGKHEYGAIVEDWETCRDLCAATEGCLQVVFYRPERKCFGMTGRADTDQDYGNGGQNPNFVSAHCHQGVVGDSGDNKSQALLDITEKVVMQKNGIGFGAVGSDRRSWLLAAEAAACVAAAMAALAAAAGVARRRLHLRHEPVAPLAALRRIASSSGSLAETVEHGLMHAKPSSEHLLDASGQSAQASLARLPALPHSSSIEMLGRYL